MSPEKCSHMSSCTYKDWSACVSVANGVDWRSGRADRDTATDVMRLSGYKAAARIEEVRSSMCHILWLTDPPHRNALQQFLRAGALCIVDFLKEFRGDRAGGDYIDGDSMASQFKRPCPSHANKARLGHAI